MEPHLPPKQHSQPHIGMERSTAGLPTRNLSPLPQSHQELRQRLERAGVANDKIATVLLAQPAVRLQPPTLPSRPPSGNGHQPPPFNSGASNVPANQPLPTLTFDVHNAAWEEINDTVYCTVSLLGPGAPMSQQSFTAVHTYNRSTYENHQLRFYRKKCLFNTCTFFPQTNEIQLERPSRGLGSKWDPKRFYWASQSGTIGQRTMQWIYHWQDPQNPNKTVLRCTTTETGYEMCKVVWLDPASARSRIELPTAIFGSCSQDQLNEMVSFAMVQLTREVASLNKAVTGNGCDQPAKKDKIKAKTWMEAAKLGMDIVSAIGGGN